MDECKTVKTWEKTRVQKLMRHKSARHYPRLTRNGKDYWKALKPTHCWVAEAALRKRAAENRGRVANADPGNAKMAFGEAAAKVVEQQAGDPNLKRRTREYHEEVRTAVFKSW